MTAALKPAAMRGALLICILIVQHSAQVASSAPYVQGRHLKQTGGTVDLTNPLPPPPGASFTPSPPSPNGTTPSPVVPAPPNPSSPLSQGGTVPGTLSEINSPPAPLTLPPGLTSPSTGPGAPGGPPCSGITCLPDFGDLGEAFIYAGYVAGFHLATLEAWLQTRVGATTASAIAKTGDASAAGEGVAAMARIASYARVLGPFLVGLGPLLAISMLFVHTPNTDMTLLSEGFSKISSIETDIATQISGMNNLLSAVHALDTYVQHRNILITINTSFTSLLRAPTLESFNAMSTPCQSLGLTPQAWLDIYAVDLSPDGSCGSGFQCILDPYAGLPNLIGYDRFVFLGFVILFYADAALAVNLDVVCKAITNATYPDLNATGNHAAAQYAMIVNNIEEYYNGPLATAFWTSQFGTDVDSVMSQSEDNNAVAISLWSLLASKYDQLRWGVAVWDGVKGSDEQGVLLSACDVPQPPASCTASGGSVHGFRYPEGNQASYAIFFSPSSEPSLELQFYGVGDVVNACAALSRDGTAVNLANWSVGNMVNQVQCISECADTEPRCATAFPAWGVRAALAVRFGNGLRAKYDGNSIYFENVQSSANCTAYDAAGLGCPKDLPEISVMALPVAP